MLRRRMLQMSLLASLGLFHGRGVKAETALTYSHFLNNVARMSIDQGIPDYVSDVAFSGLTVPNQKILDANAKQAEFSLSWEQYKNRTLTQQKINNGFNAASNAADILRAIEPLYGVPGSMLIALWGMESSYGTYTGTHPVIDTLATLAYSGKRPQFFLSELLVTLRIIYNMTILPGDLLGSYAGAMGQPQFMPSVYYKFAAKYPQKRDYSDIWHNEGDVLASIANYLKGHGWQTGQIWGEKVRLPYTTYPVAKKAAAVNANLANSTQWWARQGVSPLVGKGFKLAKGAVLQPDGPGGEAFMTYENFQVVRRYNTSDSYALSVCLLSDCVHKAIRHAV